MEYTGPVVWLGEFLRARRHGAGPPPAATPHHVAAAARRRVTGLRREEVAGYAAVSANYYTRLEQGRERHPSDAVLAALADGLRLDPDARVHLHDLARPAAPDPHRAAVAQDVEFLTGLVHALTDPALVVTPWMDVVAANDAARTLHADALDYGNVCRAVFLDPHAPSRHPRWDADAHCAVGVIRAAAGRFPHHPRVRELYGELRAASAEFGRLWDAGVVTFKTRGHKTLPDPATGIDTWEYQVLTPARTGELMVLVYRPLTGTPNPAVPRGQLS